MKKWTNSVLLETTAFRLSDEDVGLLDLEMAEIRESAGSPSGKKPSFYGRFNAIYAGTTRNMHTYLPEELSKSCEAWVKPYGKPLCTNHDVLSPAIGRIKEATYLQMSEADGVLSIAAAIPDADVIQRIRDERLLTVSVGVRSGNVECSVCGINWIEDECDHMAGRKYVMEDGSGERLCTAIIRDIDPIELSFVNVPADANAERFAGIVSFGEADDFEFYSESEGVTRKSKKKSEQVPTDIALALKESFDEFLSQLNTEGNESQLMEKEQTQTTEPVAEGETLDATTAGLESSEDSTSVETEEVSQEENDGGTDETSTENTEESSVEEDDDAAALEGILTSEETSEDEAEASTEESDDSPLDVQVVELQNRVTELEGENQDLVARLATQEESSSKWFKAMRILLGEHLADLKFALGKATEDLEALEADEARKTIKTQLSEIAELRKEFKESDFSIAGIFSQNGVLKSETLATDEPTEKSSAAKSEPVATIDEQFVNALSEHLSSRPYKRIGH